MERVSGMWPVVGFVVAVNVAFILGAMSLPGHDEWAFYADIRVPDDQKAVATMDGVRAQLEANGYHVELSPRGTALTATQASRPQYKTVFLGFGGADGPGPSWISTRVLCHVAYPGPRCPPDYPTELRNTLGQDAEAGGLSVSAATANVGDNDFSMWDEFFLALAQICLLGVSAVGLTTAVAVTRLARRRERKNQSLP